MGRCPTCGADLPAGARFCPFCGHPLEARPPAAEERRTVTIVFVDLVGFTERSDRADPEDVRRTLVPFHRRVKDDLERFEGTLDKFIGDAVMGVFGAPVAHEDDPVRAVRSALRVLGSVAELRRDDPQLAVRVAVNTGEAVVSFGAGPQVGEAVAGDVVNTASRMQSLAPHDSVVVGETTLHALGDRFEVEALPPATVKGKSEPLRVWRVVAERRPSEPERLPFVGRDRELASLLTEFGRVERDRSCRVVTVLAEAGVGKTRLAAELAQRIRVRARAIRASCPPYGEGVTFAPVEQTIRELARIEPTDDAATGVARLEALAAAVADERADRRWLTETLRAVLALDGAVGGSVIAPEELAQAWASVLATAVWERPLLLVLEDLHVGAPALLDVVRATADLLAAHPVLIVVTSRPDPSRPPAVWGSATVLALTALAEAETRRLLSASGLERALSAAVADTVIERAGGNPLFAIEIARMVGEAGTSDLAELVVPGSVQAVLAARLDAIPAEWRSVAPDAAVLGDEVWPDALAAVGEHRPADASAALAELVRRGLLEPRPSTLPGLEAYRFTHALIREVAYGRLPRAARARRHLAAGTWLEAVGGERVDEWAESLARHYASAAELGGAVGETGIRDAARAPAVRWLLTAGDRAARVDPAAASALFERALALAPPGTPEREGALRRSANAGRRSGSLDAAEVLERYLEGLEIARARGDDVAIGDWLTRAGTQLAVVGQTERARAALADAVEVLERSPHGRPLATAYAYRAEEELFAGHTTDATIFADRALALLEDEHDEVAIMALHLRGDARCSMGDLDAGLADLREALRRSEEGGSVGDVVTSRNYLAEWRWAVEGPAAGLAEWEMALELAERRNVRSQASYTKAGALSALFDAGAWDRVLAWSDDLLAVPEGWLDPAVIVAANAVRTHVLLARGRRDLVVDPDELVGVAERIQELHALAPALVAAAAIEVADGDVGAAGRRLAAFETVTEGVAPEYRDAQIVRAVRLCLAVGRPDVAERLVGSTEPSVLRDRILLEAARAMMAEARDDPGAADAYREVADRLRAFGDPFEEAMALLGHARVTGSEASRSRARELLQRLGVAAEGLTGPVTGRP
ncbi:MAG TPA: adenylate/guanylate cyclase domain-containing protein [Actinomycetota bacterium]|nr:adenylate/guanylate cyclase domain-containing protein [Actinomycetota bacterium]